MIKLLLPILLATSLSAYTINFDKPFEIGIQPDTLMTHVTISTQKSTEKEVLEKLTSFSTYISGYLDVDKKGGNYAIHPEYKYENNKRYKNGYRGNMNYQISAKKSEAVNTFIANLHDKKKDYDVDISLSSVSWELSQKQKEGQLDKLRLDAIIWINAYAKELSLELKTMCKVTKISLNAPSFHYPQPRMMEAKALIADAAPTPEQDDQKITINPYFEVECK